MSAYRYVVFPRARQPSVAEVHELKSFAGLLAGRFAWGLCRDDGRLALACEREAFDHGRTIDPGFDALVHRWEARGCELSEHLKFVKDSTALRPATATRNLPLPSGEGRGEGKPGTRAAPPPAWPDPVLPRGDAMQADERTRAKQMLAHESVAHSLLSVERTLDRMSALTRFAAAVPYLLIALAALATITLGLHLRNRLQNSGRESRQQTINRAADETLQEPDLADTSTTPKVGEVK